MLVRYVTFPVTTLGHGRRVGIWLAGCPHTCSLCMSEDLKLARPTDHVELAQLTAALSQVKTAVDGVTISGGEPFAQPEELADLVDYMHAEVSEDILVYSGYTLAELHALNDRDVERALAKIAVLIDGRYVPAADNGVGIRGSSNQVIHRLNPQADIDGYDRCERRVESFVFEDRAFVAGLM